ncbi:MAG TPA: HNH endonuclease [Clostridiaceae bacterium]
MSNQYFVFKKEVDWSLLNQGMSISVKFQFLFKTRLKELQNKGKKIDIKIVLEAEVYTVSMVNQKFNEIQYEDHKDVIQIRYNANSPISKHLKRIFRNSNDYIVQQKSNPLYIKKSGVKIPEEIKEYFVLYCTEFDDVFYAECIDKSDKEAERLDIIALNEEEAELQFNSNFTDPTSRIEEQYRFVKIRKLNRAMGENLKLLYNYKCQICGTNFSINHNCNIAESHHIEYFTKSMNNDMKNIIILCPNHHSVIHKTNAVFERKKISFIYPNGLVEKVRINLHL